MSSAASAEFGVRLSESLRYAGSVLRHHVAYYLPRGEDRMVVAKVLDFPGVLSQGLDLADPRVKIASALREEAELYLAEGKPPAVTDPGASGPGEDLMEILPLEVETGASKL